MTELVSPNQNPVIRKYLKDVLAWHGYIRFLGMPTLQTNPDVPIDELYVAQSLSLENLPTDKEPKPDQLYNPVKLLLEKHHLVVLGDPGSGKSTLINWFAWQLASGFVDRLPKELSDLIPIPIVLRELKLDKVTTFETLLDAFLERPIAKSLKADRDLLIKYCEAGKVLLLVDGLDEISLELRERLLVTFGLFFINFNTSFSIFTSRKVGYEQAPIGLSKVENKNEKSIKTVSSRKNKFLDLALNTVISISAKLLPLNPIEVFVAPFNDKQISQFSLNWYRENTTGNDDGAKFLHSEFVSSIRSNESTLQLARTPHLLTMMALIFKVRLQLPNGRALLYELIAQAYLESIDTARKLKDPFLWQEKKRWLAKVAFEMQMQRLYDEKNESQNSRELLVSREQVLSWIKDAMRVSNAEISATIDDYANEYLDWIARRSGLLLPRGEGQFAFLHLSFQEYFAAVYIQQQIENPEYSDLDVELETLDLRFSTKPLKDWTKKRNWQQVFVFLFELMAEKPGWLRKLWKECFQCLDCSNYDRVSKSLPKLWKDNIQFELQLSLLDNPHVVSFMKNSESILKELIYFSLNEQRLLGEIKFTRQISFLGLTSLSMLLSSVQWRDMVISSVESDFSSKVLYLSNLRSDVVEEVVDALPDVDSIEVIGLTSCDVQSFLIFRPFNNLEKLHVHLVPSKKNEITKIISFEKLDTLNKLKHLSLFGSGNINLEGIEKFSNLEDLELVGFRLNFEEYISNLKNLKSLTITGISDFKFLLELENLETLHLGLLSAKNNLSILASSKRLKAITFYDAKEDYVDKSAFKGRISLNFL